MALKYIPHGYGICKLLIDHYGEWFEYNFGVMNKFYPEVLEITDRFVNNQGNYKNEVIGYRYKFKLELIDTSYSKLGNQLDVWDFINEYWSTEYPNKAFKVRPQYSLTSGFSIIQNVTEFFVICEKPPQIEPFKINRMLGEKLVLTLITRDLIGKNDMWTPYRRTDGVWGGYEPCYIIMEEILDNV